MKALDLSALLIFKTVVEQGGINKAAAKLNRVPSNVTTRVKQLEQDLGVKLFEREGRGLAVSSEGLVLLEYAQELLRLSSEAEAALRNVKPRGTLRIGAIENVATSAALLPPVLTRYHRLFPDVHVELLTGTSRSLVSRVRQREIEAAFVPEPYNCEKLEVQPAFQEELVLVTPPDYPRIRSPKDLADRPITVLVVGCSYRRGMESWLARGDIRPDKLVEYQSFDSVIACVAAGCGIAMVPKAVIKKGQHLRSVAAHPLPKHEAKARTQLVWRAGHRSSVLEAMKKMLAEPGLPWAA